MECCQERGLPKGGKKDELITRLLVFTQQQDAKLAANPEHKGKLEQKMAAAKKKEEEEEVSTICDIVVFVLVLV